MNEYKLTFEMVPEECWYSNLRSVLQPKDWDVVRRDAYARAKGRCSICGRSARLEAHEKWSYDEQLALQKLEDVVALCRNCHEIKHVNRTYLVGRGGEAMEHFMKVNGCTQAEYHEELRRTNEEYLRRNRVEGWVTDISWLEKRFHIKLR